MSWEEVERNEPWRHSEQERQQRENALRDQQQRQHEDFMKQRIVHFDQLHKDDRDNAKNSQPRGGAPLVVWFFGAIGALFGGVNPPLDWTGFFGEALRVSRGQLPAAT